MGRRRLTPETRRAELLDAAGRLLEARGAGVRVEDIVAEAGAAKGTFYACFRSWDDMLEAIRARRGKSYRQIADRLVERAKAGEGAAALRELGLRTVDFILGLGGLHEVLFHGSFAAARPPPPDQTPSADIAQILRLIAGAIPAEIDPQSTAEMLFAAVHQAADDIAGGRERAQTLSALEFLLGRVAGSSAASS